MVARWRERDEREAFRVYLSESVRLMAQGKWLKEPFLSIVNGGSEAEDTRGGDEIAADIIERMGLKVV